MARGIPIVTLQWIESSKQSAMFVGRSSCPLTTKFTRNSGFKILLLQEMRVKSWVGLFCPFMTKFPRNSGI